jgi:hypothetical protein
MTDARVNDDLRDEVRRLRIRVEICRAALDSLVTAQEPGDIDRARAMLARLEEEDVQRLEAEVAEGAVAAQPGAAWASLEPGTPPLTPGTHGVDADGAATVVVHEDRFDRLEAVELAARAVVAAPVDGGDGGAGAATALQSLRDALAGGPLVAQPGPPSYGWLRHPTAPPKGGDDT